MSRLYQQYQSQNQQTGGPPPVLRRGLPLQQNLPSSATALATQRGVPQAMQEAQVQSLFAQQQNVVQMQIRINALRNRLVQLDVENNTLNNEVTKLAQLNQWVEKKPVANNSVRWNFLKENTTAIFDELKSVAANINALQQV